METSVLGSGFSRAFGVGAYADLEEEIAPGVRLRDVVDPNYFEEI